MIALHKQKTTQLFHTLKEGRFLSQNDPNRQIQNLYRYVEQNIDLLEEYFSYIGITIKLRDGYCYFASLENKEQKLKTIYELLDIFAFFLQFDPNFNVGYRFSLDGIKKRIKDDITLKTQLEKIKDLNTQTLHAQVLSLVTKLQKRGFVALENEYEQQYIVLDSCRYLFKFFEKIEIKES